MVRPEDVARALVEVVHQVTSVNNNIRTIWSMGCETALFEVTGPVVSVACGAQNPARDTIYPGEVTCPLCLKLKT